jgi:COP9 signalosome complex subunit 1
LKAAVAEAQKGRDVQRYRDAWECIRIAAPSEPEASWDQGWVDQVERNNKAETQRLESELKIYKNNLVKESIRVRPTRPFRLCATLSNCCCLA